MVVQVVRFHPSARSLAYRRYFYRPSHVRVLGAALLLAASGCLRRWLPGALAGAGIAAYVFRTRRSDQPAYARVLHLTQVVVADLTEVVVFASSSFRYRTLLL